MKPASIIYGLLLLSTGCMHSVHQVHVSDFSPYSPFKGGELVKASSERLIVMGFSSDTDYVDVAYESLQENCPQGRIQGVTTQFSTSLGFFSWTNKILMQGLCVR